MPATSDGGMFQVTGRDRWLGLESPLASLYRGFWCRDWFVLTVSVSF